MTDTGIRSPLDKERPPATLLIVEDEAIVALDLQSQLTDMGYSVCGIADNGLDAIAAAWKFRPSLILMDIVLKGEMSGVDVAQHINHGLHIPIIFLTAYSDLDTIRRAAETASYGYLTKPFRPHELRAAIEVALYKSVLERQLRDSERWFASTLRSVADGIVATDSAGAVRFMNPSAEALLGWTMSAAIGHDVAEIAPIANKETGALLESPATRALRHGKTTDIDFGSILISKNGQQEPIDDSAAPVKDEEGHVLGAVMVFRSVRERLLTEEKLRESEEYFRSVFDFAPVGMALLGLDNRFLRVNKAICALLGFSEEDLVGANQDNVAFADNPENEHAILAEVLSGQSLCSQFEKRYRTHDGKIVWVLINVSLLRQHGEPLCYLWQVHDLTERKDVELRLARLAHFDPLTGLANRAFLSDEIERHIQFARRHHERFAVIFLDLDHFKQINDSLGHEAGDDLLRSMATKLKNSVREIDTVARLGGDEFVMLLSEIQSMEDVLTVTDKLRAECARPFNIAGHEMTIGVSLGVSLYPDDAEDAKTLLRYADSALYHAKAEGRNNVQFYRHELIERMQRRMTLEAGLRVAMERNEFELRYQPIISLADGMPSMAEALLRWNHPTLGVLPPDTFIPLIEEIGLSDAVGSWVIRESCRAAASWPTGDREGLVVSINVSPMQFRNGKLVDIVREALADSGLPANRVCIEITEQLLLNDNEVTRIALRGLEELGVKIAIDDFGTGYSSLSYIGRLAPSEVKIDRSLVHSITSNNTDAAIVRAAIVMAHSLNMRVVTEGVENIEQEQVLRKDGCDMAQGYLYAAPYRDGEFRAWLNSTC